MKLEDLKSAVAIEDQGEIHKALSGRKHGSPQTAIDRTKDGATKVMKAAGDAAPLAPTITATDVETLTNARSMPWNAAYADRVIDYWGSDERVDAHGDIVLQNWRFDEFENNSPMPFSHEWEGLAVGRVLDWQVRQRTARDYQGEALWLRGLFATAEQYPFADNVFRLVKGGIFPAGSVGFWPERILRLEDPKERAELGMPEHGFILDKNHLLEFSPTLLGANPGALTVYARAKSLGLLKAEDFLVIREHQRLQIKRGAGDLEVWRELEINARHLQRLLFAESAFEKHDALDEPFVQASEEQTLRGYVRAEELKSVEDRLDQIITTLNEALPSLSRVVEDVRETVEGLKERPSKGAKPEAETSPLSSRTLDRVALLSQKLGSDNT